MSARLMKDGFEGGSWAVGREEQSQKAKRKSQKAKVGASSALPFDFCVSPFDLHFGFFVLHSIRSEVS